MVVSRSCGKTHHHLWIPKLHKGAFSFRLPHKTHARILATYSELVPSRPRQPYDWRVALPTPAPVPRQPHQLNPYPAASVEEQLVSHDQRNMRVVSSWSTHYESVTSAWYHARSQGEPHTHRKLRRLLLCSKFGHPGRQERLPSLWRLAQGKDRSGRKPFHQGSNQVP